MDRIQAKVTELSGLVDVAEKMAEEGAATRRFSNILGGYVKAIETFGEGEALSVFAKLDGPMIDAWAGSFPSVKALAETVGKISGSDRTEGDAISKALLEVVGNVLVADDLTESVRGEIYALTSRWAASAPTTTGSGRATGTRVSGGSKPLGFKVVVLEDGKPVASSEQDNLNSLRYQLVTRHASKHGGVKPTRGEPLYDGWTDALELVMHKGTASAQGGGFVFSRHGDLPVAEVSGEAPTSPGEAPEAQAGTEVPQEAEKAA